MVTGDMAIFEGGREIDTMYPARWFYRKHESEPTTEVAIRRAFGGDLYLTLMVNTKDLSNQNASLEMFVNPLVDWIWVGFAVMAIGTGIALLPERTFEFAMAKMPSAEAAATTVALLLVLFLSTVGVSAQSMGNGRSECSAVLSAHAVRDSDAARACLHFAACGHGHRRMPEGDPCGVSAEMRGYLASLIDQGKNHDEIIQAFVQKYGGQEVLGAPIDKGFNRLAWLVPYALGATGITIVGFAATRWSRRHDEPPPSATAASDPGLDDRLDDELRNLD